VYINDRERDHAPCASNRRPGPCKATGRFNLRANPHIPIYLVGPRPLPSSTSFLCNDVTMLLVRIGSNEGGDGPFAAITSLILPSCCLAAPCADSSGARCCCCRLLCMSLGVRPFTLVVCRVLTKILCHWQATCCRENGKRGMEFVFESAGARDHIYYVLPTANVVTSKDQAQPNSARKQGHGTGDRQTTMHEKRRKEVPG